MPAFADPLRTLILEDEPRFRSFLVEVLQDMGCRPVAASTAREAMDRVRESSPELLILDLNLPVTDGLSFLEQFRVACPNAAVVIITGFGDMASARRAIRLDVDDFLTKPCDLGEIESAVDRARRRLRGPDHRAAPVPSTVPSPVPSDPAPAPLEPLAVIERTAILEALQALAGNRTAVARQLGISRRTLYDKLAMYRREGHEIP